MPAIDRTLRDKETREAEQRERPFLPPGQFPSHILAADPNVRYRFVRTHYSGVEEDKGALYKRMQSGWRPVMAEELPELEYLKDPNTGWITMAGTVLCKNSVENTQKLVDYYQRMAEGQAEGAASEFETSQDPRVPKFSEGNLRTRTRTIRR